MIRAAVFLALGFGLAYVAWLLRPRVRLERPERIDMTPQNSGSGGTRHWKGYVSTRIPNSPSWTRDSSAGFGESGW